MVGTRDTHSAGWLTELRSVLQWAMQSWWRPAATAADWEQDSGTGPSLLSTGAEKQPSGATGSNAERGHQGVKSTPQGH